MRKGHSKEAEETDAILIPVLALFIICCVIFGRQRRPARQLISCILASSSHLRLHASFAKDK